MNIFGKRSDLPFSRKSDRKKEKCVVSFTHEQNIICSQTHSQTQFDDIAHQQTIICRQLFSGHLVGFRPMTRKNSLYRMIMSIMCNTLSLSWVILPTIILLFFFSFGYFGVTAVNALIHELNIITLHLFSFDIL